MRDKYDWKAIKKRHVEDGVRIHMLSREYAIRHGLVEEGSPEAAVIPPLSTIKGRALKKNWEIDRVAFQIRKSKEGVSLTQAEEIIAAEAELRDIQQVMRQHVLIARSFQSFYLDAFPAIQAAFKHCDFERLAKTDPKEFIGAVQKLMGIMKEAADMERKALGMSDPASRVELQSENATLHINKSLDEVKAELDALDESEIIRRYMDGK